MGADMFDAFWAATGEPPFDAILAPKMECYRLRIVTSRTPQHRVYRFEKSATEVSRFVGHFFVFGPNLKDAGVRTCEMAVEESLWNAWNVLLEATRFWELPSNSDRWGLDGETHTMEAWKAGRIHHVRRWSPSPLSAGGELFAVVTDYLHRLGELAMLECDSGLRSRYAPDYLPTRQFLPRGNLT